MKQNIFVNLAKIVNILVFINSSVMPALAQDKYFSTCWECGTTVGDNTYKMCTWGGKLKDPNQVACCPPESKSIYCQPNDTNICSLQKTVEGAKWFSYCPTVIAPDKSVDPPEMKLNPLNKENCGGYNQLYPYPEEQFFGLGGMGWGVHDKPWLADAKEPQYCYWMINSIPTWTYEAPKLELEFTNFLSLGEDVNVNVYKGNSLKTMVPVSTGSVKVGDKFSIGQEETFIITAYPNEKTISGEFEFKYKISGKEYAKYWQLYYQTVKDREHGAEYEIIGLSSVGCFLCLCFSGIAYCIKVCCGPKNKVADEEHDTEAVLKEDGTYDSTNSKGGYAQPGDDSKGYPVNDTNGNLELQSFNEDTANDDVEAPVQEKVKKDNLVKQQREVKDHYANPFKKHQVYPQPKQQHYE